MGRLFYLMGKSATGKDHIYRDLKEDASLKLQPLVIYTTRPMRRGEQEGREYFFTDEKELARMRSEHRVIEERVYQTVNGPWYYFTADDGRLAPERGNRIGIGTLESFCRLRDYFGEDTVLPVYIETDDGIRLERALRREKKQAEPNYAELCRRFLADTEDFSEQNLCAAGISRRFRNNGRLTDCVEEIRSYILSFLN